MTFGGKSTLKMRPNQLTIVLKSKMPKGPPTPPRQLMEWVTLFSNNIKDPNENDTAQNTFTS
jgi:hypothetical protein